MTDHSQADSSSPSRMSGLTVVIVNDFAYVNGGAAQVALASAEGLVARGVNVVLFSAVGPVAKSLYRSGIEINCLGQQEIARDPNRWRAITQGLWNDLAATRLTELLRGLDPGRTIVHVHGWTKALSSSVFRASRQAGLPLVVTMHDYFLACPNGGFFNYPANKICHLTAMSPYCLATNCDKHGYSQKLYRVARQASQRTRGGVPHEVRNYIALSELGENTLRPYLPKDARVFRLNNPIWIEASSPADVAGNKLFLAVGRLSHEKGPFLFAEAARRCGVSAVWVGDGELREQLTARYPEVQVTGWLSPREVIGYLKASRALVFASLSYEAQPMVTFEAAASGVPAIVSDTCAAREFVEEGKTGLWYRGGDSASLAENISRLKDEKIAASLGAEAYRRYWQDPPTLERHVSGLEQIYAEILGSHRR